MKCRSSSPDLCLHYKKPDDGWHRYEAGPICRSVRLTILLLFTLMSITSITPLFCLEKVYDGPSQAPPKGATATRETIGSTQRMIHKKLVHSQACVRAQGIRIRAVGTGP